MIVIANKTEIKLRDDLRNFARSKPNQRCFLLEFSKADIPKEGLFEKFLGLLESLPNSYMARVYLCQDKDIFIIMEGFMQRQFQEFVKQLSVAFGDDNLADIVDVFEIGIHWSKLEILYTDKINAIDMAEENQREERRKLQAEQNTAEVMKTLDANLVSTIYQRRLERTKPRVMIADDDQLSRTLAGNVLRTDYELSFAKNGSEALKEYVETVPDILFLDIGGHEVLETIFQIDPDAYIIMFSGRKDKATIMRSLEMGAQGFLGKPFTREQLYSHVGNSPFVQQKIHEAA